MNNDFTIGLGTKRRMEHHGRHEESGFTVTLADTGLDSMTGKRVKAVQKYVDGETFMVTYGDGLSDVDVQKLLAFHKSHGKLATVTTVRPISRFGILELDDTSKVSRFNEKPQLDGWINSGFFVFNRGVFDYLSDDVSCTLEEAPLHDLAKQGQLVAYQHDGFFYAMDTYREYKLLNDLWDSGRAPWKVWR
jgi:glucose-1-phosphate cytidylyltransferase